MSVTKEFTEFIPINSTVILETKKKKKKKKKDSKKKKKKKSTKTKHTSFVCSISITVLIGSLKHIGKQIRTQRLWWHCTHFQSLIVVESFLFFVFFLIDFNVTLTHVYNLKL
jgi:hypothetical protein